MARRAGGHEPRTQGDEGGPGDHPDLHPDDSDCQLMIVVRTSRSQ